jgi:hypothetical protein
MTRLINFWSINLFIDLLLTIVLFGAFFISFTNRNKHPQLKFLPLYFASFIFLNLFHYIDTVFFEDNASVNISWMADYIDATVTLLEFLAFIYLLHCNIQSKEKRLLIKWIAIAGTTIMVIVAFTDTLIYSSIRYRSLTFIYLLESVLLLIPCLFFFYQLFTSPPKLKLIQNADFWAITGLTFYIICTFPISLVLIYFFETDYKMYLQTFIIIYVFYILLFLMIIKSYLCRATSLT